MRIISESQWCNSHCFVGDGDLVRDVDCPICGEPQTLFEDTSSASIAFVGLI